MNTCSNFLTGIRNFWISKSQRILCVPFSWTDSGLCIYHFAVWSNLSFSHNSLWITFPSQSCLILYSLCASLLHSLILWLIVSSLSQNKLVILLPIIIIIIIIIIRGSCFTISAPLNEAVYIIQFLPTSNSSIRIK